MNNQHHVKLEGGSDDSESGEKSVRLRPVDNFE